MDIDSIECVSSVDGLEEEEIPHLDNHHSNNNNNNINHHHQHQFPVKRSNIVVPTVIAPATSVHELLECPVCTNSMYPPIHQNIAVLSKIFNGDCASYEIIDQ